MELWMPYITRDFPIEFVNAIVHKEVQGKKPIYNLHRWWARRVGTTFRMMLLTALSPSDLPGFQNLAGLREDADPRLLFYDSRPLSTADGQPPIVLDPFMGGGTTIVEGLKLGCKVVGVDLNPVAWFVTRKEVDPVDLEALQREFERLEATVGERIKGYYKATCPDCGREADIVCVFWVKVARCGNPACGKDVPLFDEFMLADHKERQRKNAPLGSFTVLCPTCEEVFQTTTIQDEVSCPACGRGFVPAQGYVGQGKYTCPACGQQDQVVSALRRLDEPLPARMFALEYYCSHCDARAYKRIDPPDVALYEQARAEVAGRWSDWLGRLIPYQEVLDGEKTRDLLRHNYLHFHQMFNERQLLCLGYLLEGILSITDENIREFFLATFSNALTANNMFCRYDAATLKIADMFGRHAFWPPNSPVENNLWGAERLGRGSFVNYVDWLQRAKGYALQPYEALPDGDAGLRNRLITQLGPEVKKLVQANRVLLTTPIIGTLAADFQTLADGDGTCLLRCQTAEDLSFLPDAGVDAVITDPPYYSNVMYAELSDFFYVWLRLGLKDHYPEAFGPPYAPKGREIVVNEKQGKTEQFFLAGLARVFRECRRVLKDDGIMAFTFHHAEADAWADVLQALLDAGFYVVAVYPVFSEMRTSGHIRGKQARTFDTIVVARKKTPATERGEISWERLKDQVYRKATDAIEVVRRTHPQLMEDFLPDVETIVFGKCLEVYSQHSLVTDEHGQTLTAREATREIHGLVGALLAGEGEVDADPVSTIFAVRLSGQDSLSFDELNKMLQPRGLNPEAFVEANLLRSSRGRYSPVPADKRGAEIAQRGKYRYDLDIVDHVYYLVKSGKVYPRQNVPQLPPDRGWNDLLQRGQSLASALFMRTGDETYKKVRRTLERLGRDISEERALQQKLL
jgi:adenine-specific DNA methylase